MADNAILLNGTSYALARDSLLPKGARRWSVSVRPSQPTDPTLPTQVMEWQTWGDNFHSFEVIQPGQTQGLLAVDYGDDTDSRWDGINTLGPLMTTIDLSAVSGTPQNTNCCELSGTMNATQFLYIGRGNHLAKVNPSTMLRVVEASANLAGNVISLLYTKATNGTQEISVGLRTATYPVLTGVANAGSNDTYTNNSQSIINSCFYGAPDRVFGAQDTASSSAATVRANFLTGSVTMAAPAWVTAGTMPSDSLQINSLANDGNFLMVGTDGGIYTVDPDYNKFRPIDPETERDSVNCIAVYWWMSVGTFFNLKTATRFLKWGEGSSVGPEQFTGFTGPVGNRSTAGAGSDRWLYVGFLNPITGVTYLCAGRPRQQGDNHGNPISWYTLRKTSSAMNFLRYLGTIGGVQALPTLVGGQGTDAFYISMGRTTRFPDDTSYLYCASGTTYYTESRRDMDLIKDVEAIEFEALGCSANQTITIGASFDGAAAVTLTGSTAGVNDTVKSNGFARRLPVDNSGVPLTTWSGRRIKPQTAYATNDSTKAPQVVGKLRMLYRARPIVTKVYEFTLILQAGEHEMQSQRDAIASLVTLSATAPIPLEDPDGNTVYVRVQPDGLQFHEVLDKAGSQNTGAGTVSLAQVTAVLWPTAAGQ